MSRSINDANSWQSLNESITYWKRKFEHETKVSAKLAFELNQQSQYIQALEKELKRCGYNQADLSDLGNLHDDCNSLDNSMRLNDTWDFQKDYSVDSCNLSHSASSTSCEHTTESEPAISMDSNELEESKTDLHSDTDNNETAEPDFPSHDTGKNRSESFQDDTATPVATKLFTNVEVTTPQNCNVSTSVLDSDDSTQSNYRIGTHANITSTRMVENDEMHDSSNQCTLGSTLTMESHQLKKASLGYSCQSTNPSSDPTISVTSVSINRPPIMNYGVCWADIAMYSGVCAASFTGWVAEAHAKARVSALAHLNQEELCLTSNHLKSNSGGLVDGNHTMRRAFTPRTVSSVSTANKPPLSARALSDAHTQQSKRLFTNNSVENSMFRWVPPSRLKDLRPQILHVTGNTTALDPSQLLEFCFAQENHEFGTLIRLDMSEFIDTSQNTTQEAYNAHEYLTKAILDRLPTPELHVFTVSVDDGHGPMCLKTLYCMNLSFQQPTGLDWRRLDAAIQSTQTSDSVKDSKRLYESTKLRDLLLPLAKEYYGLLPRSICIASQLPIFNTLEHFLTRLYDYNIKPLMTKEAERIARSSVAALRFCSSSTLGGATRTLISHPRTDDCTTGTEELRPPSLMTTLGTDIPIQPSNKSRPPSLMTTPGTDIPIQPSNKSRTPSARWNTGSKLNEGMRSDLESMETRGAEYADSTKSVPPFRLQRSLSFSEESENEHRAASWKRQSSFTSHLKSFFGIGKSHAKTTSHYRQNTLPQQTSNNMQKTGTYDEQRQQQQQHQSSQSSEGSIINKQCLEYKQTITILESFQEEMTRLNTRDLDKTCGVQNVRTSIASVVRLPVEDMLCRTISHCVQQMRNVEIQLPTIHVQSKQDKSEMMQQTLSLQIPDQDSILMYSVGISGATGSQNSYKTIDLRIQFPTSLFDTVGAKDTTTQSFMSPEKALNNISTFRTRIRHIADAFILDYCAPCLVSVLPTHTLLKVIAAILTERTVVVTTSPDVSMENEPTEKVQLKGSLFQSSCAALALSTICLPFRWVGPIIPALSDSMIDLLSSPVPLLAGVSRIHKNMLHAVHEGDGMLLHLRNGELYTGNMLEQLLPVKDTTPSTTALSDTQSEHDSLELRLPSQSVWNHELIHIHRQSSSLSSQSIESRVYSVIHRISQTIADRIETAVKLCIHESPDIFSQIKNDSSGSHLDALDGHDFKSWLLQKLETEGKEVEIPFWRAAISSQSCTSFLEHLMNRLNQKKSSILIGPISPAPTPLRSRRSRGRTTCEAFSNESDTLNSTYLPQSIQSVHIVSSEELQKQPQASQVVSSEKSHKQPVQTSQFDPSSTSAQVQKQPTAINPQSTDNNQANEIMLYSSYKQDSKMENNFISPYTVDKRMTNKTHETSLDQPQKAPDSSLLRITRPKSAQSQRKGTRAFSKAEMAYLATTPKPGMFHSADHDKQSSQTVYDRNKQSSQTVFDSTVSDQQTTRLSTFSINNKQIQSKQTLNDLPTTQTSLTSTTQTNLAPTSQTNLVSSSKPTIPLQSATSNFRRTRYDSRRQSLDSSTLGTKAKYISLPSGAHIRQQ